MATARSLSHLAPVNLDISACWSRPWESARGCVLSLSVWCAVLFFYGIGAGDLFRTEGLRARIAQEMFTSGHWIVPTLYSEPIFTKPPLMYWAIILCSIPFGGVTSLSARLPSALAGSATVLLFFFASRRYLGLRGAWRAALILPMSAMWLDKAPSAEIDTLQVCWVTASLLCFFRAVDAEEACEASGRWWYSALLFMALGVLTKWTAPAFFYGAAVPFLCWRGRLRLLLSRHHVLGLALAIALCLAWISAAVHQTSVELFTATIKQEALTRLVPNYERPYRPLEALAHPFKLLAMTLPWSFFALATLRPGFQKNLDSRGRFFLQAMHAWTWPNILICTYLAEHTPRHSFPLFPGIAGLAAVALLTWQERAVQPRRLQPRPWQLLTATLMLWIAVKIVHVEVILPQRTEKRQVRSRGERLASLIPAGRMLYLFLFKDDGLLFYFGRPALRLPGPESLPQSDEPLYCIVTVKEWPHWPPSRRAEVVQTLRDQQGDEFLLLKVH